MNNYIFSIPTEPLMVPHFSSYFFLIYFFHIIIGDFDFLFFENHNNVNIRNTIFQNHNVILGNICKFILICSRFE